MVYVYLSGPITHANLDIKRSNIDSFNAWEEFLKNKGFEVCNPIKIIDNEGRPWEYCMKNDIGALLSCDGIAMLPSWRHSRGARLELHIAQELGMPIYDATTGERLHVEDVAPLGPERSAQSIAERYLQTPAGHEELKKRVIEKLGPALATDTCLDRAKKAVFGDRRRDYDTPLKNHERIAYLWNAFLAGKGMDGGLEPEDVAAMMILLKIARGIHSWTEDTITDMAGYSACIELIIKERNGENISVA